MPIDIKALNILAFPQQWDGNALGVRFLCLPRRDPEAPLQPGGASFATADLRFEARLIGSPDRLPRSSDAVAAAPQPLVLDELPAQKSALFAELHNHFAIRPAAIKVPPASRPTFRKPITESYRMLVGDRQLSDGLADHDDYLCGLHEAHAAQPLALEPIDPARSWGEVIAFALRQPKFATALGLSGQSRIVPPADFFTSGGWLYVTLSAGGDFAGDDALVTSFAARIPPLDANPRAVYSALLFPVDSNGVADEGFADVTHHDRGFARLVHAALGDRDGDGIRLAWDDEFIADDFARQVSGSTSRPMATAGFRVDVRDGAVPDGAWHSLQRIESRQDLTLGPLVVGSYAGEAAIEVVPVQASPARPGDFWMPPYFCTWRGASLALTDASLVRLHEGAAIEPEFEAHRLGREQVFVAVDDRAVPLLYGHRYEFRVRLVDLSRGGPDVGTATPDDPTGAAHHIVAIAFQRHRRPGALAIQQRPTRDAMQIVLGKPRLGHPEYLFTGAGDFDTLLAAARADADAGVEQEFGLPDSDVVAVRVRLEVAALTGEAVQWLPVYETNRAMPAETLTIALEALDLPDVATIAAIQPDAGPLPVPTARRIRFTFTAVGRDDAGYFANDEARSGDAITVELRAIPAAEPALFAGAPELTAFFFRDGGAARPLARMADATGLEARTLTVTGRAEGRVVFGCAAALGHILSPDGASLTLSSDADLTQRWISVLKLDLGRDWTWEGLAANGVVIQRTIRRAGQADVTEVVGTIAVPYAVPRTEHAAPGLRDLGRASSRLVFVDAIDPKPLPLGIGPVAGQFPAELDVSYQVGVTLRDDLVPPEPVEVSVRLPITTPPVQVPRLVSAGIALSPYVAADDYSMTSQRDRSLWLEFDAAPIDPQDRYFVRVLASAPDPLLIETAEAPLAHEPALPIDSETMRMIVPGQPRDDNGLQAMQSLDRQGDGGPIYLVPLPDGLVASSAALLGMFTYEIRLGHAGPGWSTAQGRFGPPLRVAGVQHPPPPLVCQTARLDDRIKVRAPFATPQRDGASLRPRFPKTRLWGVIYARLMQADGAAWRNLILFRLPLRPFVQDPARPSRAEIDPPLLFGEAELRIPDLDRALAARGLGPDTPLTALAVEFMTEPEIDDPLGSNLAQARMLRVSALTTVPDLC